jgi:hypothetical protein
MKIKPVVTGLATYVPGLWERFRGATGGTVSARYCYSVWLRHLVVNTQNGMPGIPRVVAELGPGDSIGIGLAALISGVEKYFALDIVRYARDLDNLRVFDELVGLFQQQASIPGADEFPRVIPELKSYAFPAHILTPQHLAEALAPERIERLRADLRGINGPGADSSLVYAVPWTDDVVVRKSEVDLIMSQAVLEHVDDLPGTYAAMHSWLKPNGWMSHAIDFKSHGITEEWNGHWAFSPVAWRIVRGKRSYLLNRAPASVHHRLLRNTGFEIVKTFDQVNEKGIARNKLADGFRELSDSDFGTATSFVVATKK